MDTTILPARKPEYIERFNVDLLQARNEVKHAHSLHDKVKEAFPDLANADESIEFTIAETNGETMIRPALIWRSIS